jgi:hypothetical protein
MNYVQIYVSYYTSVQETNSDSLMKTDKLVLHLGEYLTTRIQLKRIISHNTSVKYFDLLNYAFWICCAIILQHLFGERLWLAGLKG